MPSATDQKAPFSAEPSDAGTLVAVSTGLSDTSTQVAVAIEPSDPTRYVVDSTKPPKSARHVAEKPLESTAHVATATESLAPTPQAPVLAKPSDPAKVARKEPSIRSNPHRIKCYLTLAAIKLLRRVRPHCGSILFLTSNICVKFGTLIYPSEAAGMEWVATNTSIPVPKVYCVFQRKGATYIVMERVKGRIIGQGWIKRPVASNETFLQQLRDTLKEQSVRISRV